MSRNALFLEDVFMSNYIVLVKQVPDVTQITDNAFDPESGTLIRSRLASVINELDAQALAFANQMKLLSGDREAYRYLPRSVAAFPPAAELAALMGSAGLGDVSYRLLGGGTVALHSGTKGFDGRGAGA